ncbi:beta strand repeat-containing protein, partial [Winogradskyella vincentii]|nr:hypothetical protein [Winogradskyella vincentii]
MKKITPIVSTHRSLRHLPLRGIHNTFQKNITTNSNMKIFTRFMFSLKQIKIATLFGILTLIGSQGLTAQNLITNPGLLESSVDCTATDSTEDLAPDSWGKIGAPDLSTSVERRWDGSNQNRGASPDGTCYIGLTVDSGTTVEGITQNVTVVGGELYSFSLDYLIETDNGETPCTPGLEVLLDGSVIGTFAAPASEDVWTRPRFTFTPSTSGSFLLEIKSTGTCDKTWNFIDGVDLSLNCDITAIDESDVQACSDNGTPEYTGDDTFTADITVTYANPKTTGTLNLSGSANVSVPVGSIGATSYTFQDVVFTADGSAISLTANFSADGGCSITDTNIMTAPSECSDITCPSGSYIVNATESGTYNAFDALTCVISGTTETDCDDEALGGSDGSGTGDFQLINDGAIFQMAGLSPGGSTLTTYFSKFENDLTVNLLASRDGVNYIQVAAITSADLNANDEFIVAVPFFFEYVQYVHAGDDGKKFGLDALGSDYTRTIQECFFDIDNDGVQDRDDQDDDNDGILDLEECGIPRPQPFTATAVHGYAQTKTGGRAAHYDPSFALTTSPPYAADDPRNIIDGTPQPLRMHVDDFMEINLGQEVAAGTVITLQANTSGEDTPVQVYVSYDSTDPSGDANTDGQNGGVGYLNAVTNGQSTLVVPFGTDTATDVTFTAPITFRYMQFEGHTTQHGGWDEIAFPGGDLIVGTVADCDTDGDGFADYLDTDSDNDGCPDVLESGGTDVVPAGGDGILDGDGFNSFGQVTTGGAIAVGSYDGVTGDEIVPLQYIAGANPPATLTLNSGDALTLTSDATAQSTIAWDLAAPFDPDYSVPGNVSDESANLQYAWTFDDGTGAISVGGNNATFNIASASTTDSGTYTVTITHLNNPCIIETQSSVVTVNPVGSVITASDDVGQVVENVGGVVVPNVLANDDLNGSVPTTSTVDITQISTSDPGVQLNVTNGEVTVNPTVPPGIYTIIYEICEVPPNASNCSTTTAQVRVFVLGDIDGDGIEDIADLDDDNDGILDTIECTAFNSPQLLNGDFEDNDILLLDNDGSTDVVPTLGIWKGDASNIPNWESADAVNNHLEVWHNTQAAGNDVGGVAYTGTQWAEINATTNDGLYQDVVTTPGDVLQWSFAHRKRTGFAGSAVEDVMTLLIGDATGALVSQGNFTSAADASWTAHSGTYTVPAGQTTTRLSFAWVSSASGSSSTGNFIDNIQLFVISDCEDTDGDGIDDYLDLDSDNDGIYDVDEAGNGALDDNNDGVIDSNDTGFTDTNTNGTDDDAEVTTPVDTLTDGSYDFQNTDSDGDGCPDANEAYSSGAAAGSDDGQFGEPDPASINPLNGLVTEVGVDYTLGTNSAVTDAGDTSACAALTITANNDDFSATTFGSAGGTTSTVFTNDDANGTTPATNALIDNNINISNDDGLIGVVINNNGTIDVPFGATPGTYNVEYQICLTADNTICDTAIATIVIVDDCDAIASGNVDTDGDGISDVCDEDDDNDGILDTVDLNCAPGPLALGQTFSDNTGSNFNAEFIPNVYAYGGASVTFGYEPYGGSAWSLSGITNQNNPVILPDGEYINTIADGTTFPENEHVRYYFIFSEPVYNVNFKVGGLDNADRADFSATNGTDNVPVNISDINVGANLTINGQSAVTAASAIANAPSNSIAIQVDGPVTQIIIDVGNQDGNEFENVEVQFYEMEYCLPLDTDGDGVIDILDLDSDNDGIYDVDEVGGADANNDGQADGAVGPSGIPGSAGTGITPIDTLSDGSFDYQNTDSDGDGCPDANEAYGNVTAAGIDDGQFNFPDPANVDASGLVDLGLLVDYDIGTNAAVTDPSISAVCDPCNALVSGNTDTDGDGVSDICDEDNDNDGILDIYEQNCSSGPIPLGQTFSDNTGSNFNAEFIPNVYSYGGASVTFGYEPYGGSAWSLSGITNQNNPAILPDGEYINTIADGTTFPEGEVVRYLFIFSEPVYNVNFKVGGLDNFDRADFIAVNGTENIPVNLSDINVGANLTIANQSAVTGASANANAPSNSIAVEVLGPVTQITVYVGNQAGNEFANVELQFYEMQYCLSNDTDGDGIDDAFDLDADNDGIYDIDEAGNGSLDTNGDGIIDSNDAVFNDGNGNGVDDATEVTIPIDTGGDGSFDFQNTDSDGDSCPDANEAYASPFASGTDGGQFGEPDPASVDGNGLVTETGVDYSLGSNIATVDPLDNSACIITPSISTVKTFVDIDGGALTEYNTVGQVINYTITLTNNGNVTVYNPTVVDATATTGPTLVAASDIDSDGILSVGEVWTYTATHTVTQADIDNGSYTNTAEGEGLADTDNDGTGDATVESDESETLNASQNPSIELTKTSAITTDVGPAGASLGDEITYTFSVDNTGNVTISNIAIDDALTGSVDLAISPSTLAPGATGTV